MPSLAEALHIRPGVTAIIGSGGKTTLMLALASELQEKGSVIVTTSTHIFPPEGIRTVQRAESVNVQGILCVGTPCEHGKLAVPAQSFEELAELADFVLVEADGSRHLPVKVHRSFEPVIPANANETVCVIGASGLNRPIEEAVHGWEQFYRMTGEKITTPEAVAKALRMENLADRYVINQADVNEEAARALGALLHKPAAAAILRKGEILCSF